MPPQFYFPLTRCQCVISPFGIELPSSSELIIFLLPALSRHGTWFPSPCLEDEKDPLTPWLEEWLFMEGGLFVSGATFSLDKGKVLGSSSFSHRSNWKEDWFSISCGKRRGHQWWHIFVLWGCWGNGGERRRNYRNTPPIHSTTHSLTHSSPRDRERRQRNEDKLFRVKEAVRSIKRIWERTWSETCLCLS